MLRSCSVLASANWAKAPVREVGGLESAWLHAEQVRPQRRIGILIFRGRWDAWQDRQMRVRGPIAVVNAQRFAISVADQRRAIHNLRRPALRGLKVLRLGQESEPAAEGSLVVRILQAEEIRRAVAGGIPGIEIGQQGDSRRRLSRNCNPHHDDRRSHARANLRLPAMIGSEDIVHAGGMRGFDRNYWRDLAKARRWSGSRYRSRPPSVGTGPADTRGGSVARLSGLAHTSPKTIAVAPASAASPKRFIVGPACRDPLPARGDRPVPRRPHLRWPAPAT